MHLPSKHTGTRETDLTVFLRRFFSFQNLLKQLGEKLVKLEALETISSAISFFFLLSQLFFPPSLTSQRACTRERQPGESKHVQDESRGMLAKFQRENLLHYEHKPLHFFCCGFGLVAFQFRAAMIYNILCGEGRDFIWCCRR